MTTSFALRGRNIRPGTTLKRSTEVPNLPSTLTFTPTEGIRVPPGTTRAKFPTSPSRTLATSLTAGRRAKALS